MHTEHLQNVRAVHIAAGWLIAVSVTSMAFLGFAGFRLIPETAAENTAAGGWAFLAVAIGFMVGGFFAGFRSLHAPILHGIGIGIASLVAWFGVNLVGRALSPDLEWEALTPTLTAGLLLAQMVFAVGGAWFGYRLALRGEAEPEE